MHPNRMPGLPHGLLACVALQERSHTPEGGATNRELEEISETDTLSLSAVSIKLRF